MVQIIYETKQLTKFNVYAIQKSGIDSTIEPGRGLFLIDIKDSLDAPHQAADNKYYLRVGGKSRPIGHRIVMDIFGRQKYPLIMLSFLRKTEKYYDYGDPLRSIPRFSEQDPSPTTDNSLQVVAFNTSNVLAKYVICEIKLPVKYAIEHFDNEDVRRHESIEIIDGTEYLSWTKKNTRRDVIKTGSGFISDEYGPSWYDPILPKSYFSWEWHVSSRFIVENDDLKIFWKVFADNSPIQTGEVRLKDIDHSINDRTKD